MDEGTAGSGKVNEDDGDESESLSDENEAASMPVSRNTVTENNAAAASDAPAGGDAEPSAE